MLQNPAIDHERYLRDYVIPKLHGIDPAQPAAASGTAGRRDHHVDHRAYAAGPMDMKSTATTAFTTCFAPKL